MTTENQQMLAALGQLHDDIAGKLPNIDAKIAGLYAAHADLKGVVNSQMSFAATIDPADVAPTEVNGGVFNTIRAAISASPAGSAVTISLPAGTQHVIDQAIGLLGREIQFQRSGAGANPEVVFAAFVINNQNQLGGFDPYLGGGVRFVNVDIAMAGKNDPGLAWSSQSTLMRFAHGSRSFLGIAFGSVTGSDGRALISCAFATSATLSLNSVALDGDFFGASTVGHGTLTLAEFSVSLANGAALYDAGTIGSNIQNN